MDHHKRVQTSEAFINSAFLAVSGGFQDAYTYFTRDGVFSNAQTGNVVLMSERFPAPFRCRPSERLKEMPMPAPCVSEI